jgi:aquaporin Z
MVTKSSVKTKRKTTTVSAKSKSKSSNTINIDLKGLSIGGKSVPLAALLAEFIGTFLLVASFFLVQGQPLYVGFALVGILLMVGGISGSHLNPAVTFGAWVTGKIGALRGLAYAITQVLGGLLAYVTLSAFLRGVEPDAFTGTSPELFHAATVPEGKEWYILFAEMLGVAILAFGMATAIKLNLNKDRLQAALVAGFGILIALVVAGTVTATFLSEANTALAFINPAIAWPAQALAWDMWLISIYIFAPFIGGAVGFILQDVLARNSEQ